MTIMTGTILDCGHIPTVTDGIGTGWARDRDDHTMCYACADSRQAAEMSTSDRFTAYLSSSGETITTWSGGALARVTRHTSAPNGWHGSDIHYIAARDASGNTWHGRNGGEGMSITLRRYK